MPMSLKPKKPAQAPKPATRTQRPPSKAANVLALEAEHEARLSALRSQERRRGAAATVIKVGGSAVGIGAGTFLVGLGLDRAGDSLKGIIGEANRSKAELAAARNPPADHYVWRDEKGNVWVRDPQGGSHFFAVDDDGNLVGKEGSPNVYVTNEPPSAAQETTEFTIAKLIAALTNPVTLLLLGGTAVAIVVLKEK